MSRWLRFGLPTLVGVAAVGIIPVLQSWNVRGDIPVSTVQRGSFVHKVVAEGLLVAETATVLSAPLNPRSGNMKIAWLAKDGTRVKAGEPVVRFDATEMEADLYNGRADRSKAESRRTQKEIEEEVAVSNLERDARLADRQLEYAHKFQSKDPEIFSRTDIIESEIDETLATKRKAHATEIQAIRKGLGRVELDLLDLEKRKAELTIERAEAGLRELEIRAPHDGIFVLRRNWGEVAKIGEVVWARQPIAEIPQLALMKAQVFVLEADAGGVQIGVPAQVALEAHPGEVFAAKVRKIAALAKRRTRYSPVQYFEVELALEHSDPAKMKPGQRIRVTLILQNLEDVLTVPREAVFEGEDDSKLVYRQSGGDFEPVEVELGPAALGRVVIESGLSEGDIIALQDPTRLGEESEQETASPAGGPPSPGTSR
ncbi:MAG: efflux RND transporter periplasmic adaptor subunit [Acidobacteriota bacterium]